MRLYAHGGTCCGITHLYLGGLSTSDEEYGINCGHMQPAIKKFVWGPEFVKSCIKRLVYTGKYDPNNGAEAIYAYDLPQFMDEAPEETPLKRFHRFVDYEVKKRPQGIIEVVLTSRQIAWHEVLVAKGFEKVSEGLNSNSGRTLSVYLLSYDASKKTPEALFKSIG